MHGWLNLNLEGSQNFSPAILLATEDGGKTWIRKDSPGDGTLRFTTADNGWLAGGQGREYLYTTRDGGTSWQEASLMNPPEVNGSSGGRYSAPFFSDQQHGFVSMTRSSSGGKILPATDDGGESWRAYRTKSDFDDSAASALADSVWFVAKSDQSSITLIRVQLGLSATVETRTAAVQVSAFPTAIRDISFATSEQGWIFTDRLYSTSDGGQSWKDAAPWPIPKMETVPSTGPQASAQTLSTDLGNVRTIVQTRAPGGIQ